MSPVRDGGAMTFIKRKAIDTAAGTDPDSPLPVPGESVHPVIPQPAVGLYIFDTAVLLDEDDASSGSAEP